MMQRDASGKLIGHTREYLIQLFTMDGRPYALKYSIRGHARESWLADRPTLNKMIEAKEVEIVDKDLKSITYLYKVPASTLPIA